MIKERIIIQNPYKLPIRIDKLLPEIFHMSRSQIKKLIKLEQINFSGTNLGETTEIIYVHELF